MLRSVVDALVSAAPTAADMVGISGVPGSHFAAPDWTICALVHSASSAIATLCWVGLGSLADG
jgi:hypothetical protein